MSNFWPWSGSSEGPEKAFSPQRLVGIPSRICFYHFLCILQFFFLAINSLMIYQFVNYRQGEVMTPYRVGGKGFLHPAQQAVRNRHDRTSLQGSFVGKQLASVDRRSQAVHHSRIPLSSSTVFGACWTLRAEGSTLLRGCSSGIFWGTPSSFRGTGEKTSRWDIEASCGCWLFVLQFHCLSFHSKEEGTYYSSYLESEDPSSCAPVFFIFSFFFIF